MTIRKTILKTQASLHCLAGDSRVTVHTLGWAAVLAGLQGGWWMIDRKLRSFVLLYCSWGLSEKKIKRLSGNRSASAPENKMLDWKSIFCLHCTTCLRSPHQFPNYLLDLHLFIAFLVVSPGWTFLPLPFLKFIYFAGLTVETSAVQQKKHHVKTMTPT